MKSGSLLASAKSWTVFTFIFGVLPLGLSSTEMWDGVVGVQALTVNNWPALKDWLLDSNWYLTYSLFVVADLLKQNLSIPHWIFFKLWIFSMVVGMAFEVYHLAQQVFEIPKSIAAWLPALVFCFPLWYVFFSFSSMVGHLTCVWLALAGYRLVHSRKKNLQAVGVTFVVLSFQLASNCAFILALELGRWVLSRHKLQWSYWRSALLVAISLGVFAATRVIWPPVGTYTGYNRFLDPLLLQSWVLYAKYSALFATWLVLLVPLVSALWWASKRGSVPKIGMREVLHRDSAKISVYALLMFAACAPYIAVGVGSPLFTVNLNAPGFVSVSSVLASNSTLGPVGVWFGGWGARHLLLMLVPMTLLAGWLASVNCQLVRSSIQAHSNPTPVAFIFTIGLCLLIGTAGHWAKLKRLAKERTIVTLLASQPPLPHGQVELLLDKKEDFLSGIYETNYLLYRAYKSTHWLAFMLPENKSLQAWGDDSRRLILDQAPDDRIKIAGLNLMGDYDWNNSCKTVARIKLPELGAWDVLWRTEHAPERLPQARIIQASSTCRNADTLWTGGAS